MKLEFLVPIFNFNYLGENKSPNDMWNHKIDFHENLKDYIIEGDYKIILKKKDFNELNFIEEIDWFSNADCNDIRSTHWTFSFECEKEKLDNYKQKFNLLLLAFRIAKHSDLSIKYIICKDVLHFSSKYSDDWKYALAEQNIKKDFRDLNNLDLHDIVIVYNQLQELFKVSHRTTHAINFLFLAYTSYYWMESYILFMTSLETLVSPSIEEGITSKIIKRTRKLINDSKMCSKRNINNLYKLRSNIIHGRVLVDLSFKEHQDEMVKLQIIVLKAFEKILSNDFHTIYKNEESKEKFFN